MKINSNALRGGHAHTEAFRDQPYERISDRTEENQELFFFYLFIFSVYSGREK